MADDKEPVTGEAGKRNSNTRIIGGAVLLFLLLAGVWFFLGNKQPQKTAPAVSSNEAGIIDVKKALQAHNAYGQLAALREERERMAVDLAIARRMVVQLLAPKAEKGPFDAAVRQKARTEEIHMHGEGIERLDAAEKAEREATKGMLESARDEINAEYFNEIFNIQLKLDNAKAMRLSKETVEELKERLRELQIERGQKQIALWKAYEAKIREHRAELAAQQGIKEAEHLSGTTERLRAEEAAKQSAAQARNMDAMQKNMLDASMIRARIQEKTLALKAKDQEIAALESHMLKEIAGKAAKLAAIHHFTVIYSTQAVNLASLKAGEFRGGMLQSGTAHVVAGTAQDITDELIREL
ncbi:hypothetical protein [Schwartzia sp. (in: firmicutes)]